MLNERKLWQYSIHLGKRRQQSSIFRIWEKYV